MLSSGLLLRTIVVAVFVAALAAVSTADAEAIRRHTLKGRPGNAYFLKVQGSGSYSGDAKIRFGGGQIGVARGYERRAQKVCENIRLFRFTGSFYEAGWSLKFQDRSCSNVRAGTHPGFDDYDYAADVTAAYHVDIVVTWYVLRTGRLVAKASYDFDELSDYACANKFCYTQYGYQGRASMGFTGF